VSHRIEGPDAPVEAMTSAVLGALSLLERVDEFVDACVAAPAAERLPPDDAALLALLGLIRLRKTSRRWFEAAASEAATKPAEELEPNPRAGLLR